MEPALIDQFVEHFDHHDPRLGEDPHAVFAAMVERCPVAYSDRHGGFWTISSYELVYYALQHFELFTTEQSVNIPPGVGQRRPLLPLETDPPAQLRYRRLLAPVFAPPRMVALEPKIRAICDSLIDGFIDRGECEFIEELAAPLPTILFTEMMGLPYEEADQFLAWKDSVLHGHHDDPSGEKRAKASQEINDYLTQLREKRKADPKDDILTLLLQSEAEGERLTDDEVHDIAYLLFIAGLDTVTSQMALHFLYLSQHPEQRDRIVKDPSLIPSAVEEMLRYESVILAGRTAVQDVEIGGVKIPKGGRVLLNMAAADRDPAQFENPHEVILDREPNRHITFAVGPHRCVGSHLARLELRIAFERMHARVPGYRLREGAEVHRHVSSVMGIDKLPLVWDR